MTRLRIAPGSVFETLLVGRPTVAIVSFDEVNIALARSVAHQLNARMLALHSVKQLDEAPPIDALVIDEDSIRAMGLTVDALDRPLFTVVRSYLGEEGPGRVTDVEAAVSLAVQAVEESQRAAG